MAKMVPQQNQETPAVKQETKHEEVSLKGTFVSVMLLGAFLALTWLGVFVLFIARN